MTNLFAIRRGAGLEQALAELADLQHGLAQSRQLNALGMGPSTVHARVLRGAFTSVHRGVVLLGRTTLDARAAALAVTLAAGSDAASAGATALWLWGAIESAPQCPEATSPRPLRPRPGMTLHQATSLHPDDLCALDHIPLTSPSRSLLDFAMSGAPDAVERALNELRAARLLPAADLDALRARTVGHHGWKWLGPLLVGDADTGFSRREAELRLWRLVREAHLSSGAKRNVRLHGWEVDAYWPDAGLVVEVDSWDFHSSRAAFERDRRKQTELQAAGLEVLRFTWRQITEQPLWVAARIAGRLAARV